MANLTDADKVLRNDTGKDIATNIAGIAAALNPSNITDLGDVNLTNPITDGQVIKYDTATQKWVNGLGNITMECDQAQYDAWKQSGQLKPNTLYVITDAPNLNATARNLSYNGGVGTVYNEVESKATVYEIGNINSSTKVITFLTTMRLMIFSSGGSNGRMGAFWCMGRASTSFVQPLLTSSVVSVTALNNQVTITSTSDNTYIHLLLIDGKSSGFTIT